MDKIVLLAQIKYLKAELDKWERFGGLYVIDRDPNTVSIEWIRKHAFQLKDNGSTNQSKTHGDGQNS